MIRLPSGTSHSSLLIRVQAAFLCIVSQKSYDFKYEIRACIRIILKCGFRTFAKNKLKCSIVSIPVQSHYSPIKEKENMKRCIMTNNVVDGMNATHRIIKIFKNYTFLNLLLCIILHCHSFSFFSSALYLSEKQAFLSNVPDLAPRC